MSGMIGMVVLAVPIMISAAVTFLLDVSGRLPRWLAVFVGVASAPIGTILYCYMAAGLQGLMIVMLAPVLLMAGVLGMALGLQISVWTRDLRGKDRF